MGVSTESQDADMAVAFNGGATFMQRMEQLAAAKLAAEKAEASLNLAISARAVLDQADAKTAEANRILLNARTEAQAILDDAAAKAAATLKTADAKSSEAMKVAAETLASADAYAADARQKADALLADAGRKNAEADAKSVVMEQRQAEQQKAISDAKAAEASAQAVEAKFHEAIQTLRGAIAQVSGE